MPPSKPWMPRNRPVSAASVLAMLAVVGCAAPKAEPVFVDVDRLLALEKVEVAGSPPLPKPPLPAGAVEQGVPAHAAQVLRDPSRATPGSLKASLEKQQQVA